MSFAQSPVPKSGPSQNTIQTFIDTHQEYIKHGITQIDHIVENVENDENNWMRLELEIRLHNVLQYRVFSVMINN